MLLFVWLVVVEITGRGSVFSLGVAVVLLWAQRESRFSRIFNKTLRGTNMFLNSKLFNQRHPGAEDKTRFAIC